MSDSALATTFVPISAARFGTEHVGQRCGLAAGYIAAAISADSSFFDLRDRAGIVQVSFDPIPRPTECAAVGGRARTRRRSSSSRAGRSRGRTRCAMPSWRPGDVELQRDGADASSGRPTPPAIPVARGRATKISPRKNCGCAIASRPAPAGAAEEHRPAPPPDAGDAALSDRERLFRDRDADPHQADPRGRTRLPRARAGCTPASSTRCRSRRSSTSSCSWSPGSTATSRSRAASATRICAPDRQPEFTQIDIEASFVSAEDILRSREGLVGALWREAGMDDSATFPRMTYAEAMERYGSDKPDTAIRAGDLRRERGLSRRRASPSRRRRSTRVAASAASACRAAPRCRASRSTRSSPRRRRAAPPGCCGSSS